MPFPGQTQLAVLQTLVNRDRSALDIVRGVAELTDGNVRVSQGSIYTILHRMEKAGFIEGYYKEEDLERRRGHPRRYYKLRGAGARVLSETNTLLGNASYGLA